MADAERLLEEVGAVLHGHFLLSSGLHSAIYVEKFQLVQRPAITVELCRGLVQHFLGDSVSTVAGPTTGGAILSFEFARQLDARSIFAEQSADGGREFRRGFMIEPGERVLVVDDVMTTGASVRHTVEAVRALGGEVVGAGLLVDRSGGRSDVGTPVRAALTLDIPAYEPDDCPECAAGAPLTKRGTSRTRSRSGA